MSTASYGHARVTATAPGGRRAVAEVLSRVRSWWRARAPAASSLYAAERANLAQLRKIMDERRSRPSPRSPRTDRGSRSPSTRDGQPEIYIMECDGTSAGRLTTPGAGRRRVVHGRTVRRGVPLQRTGHRRSSAADHQLGCGAAHQEPADNSQPTVSPDGETIASVEPRKETTISGDVERGLEPASVTRGPQSKETAPRFLRTLARLPGGAEGSGRTVTSREGRPRDGKATPFQAWTS